eukprot:TRINITY_DN71201_c0_g1_i1.p2 TRINITY_DN71201_c0_g1~~TRINITY_DN71201_c0_g1_i1.p2  ORF type:complete len:507 (+),score=70.58 TRINITY_DN71201_c0_g1_i1:223-1521(+)
MLCGVLDGLPRRLQALGFGFNGSSMEISHILHSVFKTLMDMKVPEWRRGEGDCSTPNERDTPSAAWRHAVWLAAVRLHAVVDRQLSPAQREPLNASKMFGAYRQPRRFTVPQRGAPPARASAVASAMMYPGSRWTVGHPQGAVVAVVESHHVRWRGFERRSRLRRAAGGELQLLDRWVVAATPEWVVWDDSTHWTRRSRSEERPRRTRQRTAGAADGTAPGAVGTAPQPGSRSSPLPSPPPGATPELVNPGGEHGTPQRAGSRSPVRRRGSRGPAPLRGGSRGPVGAGSSSAGPPSRQGSPRGPGPQRGGNGDAAPDGGPGAGAPCQIAAAPAADEQEESCGAERVDGAPALLRLQQAVARVLTRAAHAAASGRGRYPATELRVPPPAPGADPGTLQRSAVETLTLAQHWLGQFAQRIPARRSSAPRCWAQR